MEALSPNWTVLIGFLLWGGSYLLLKHLLFEPYGELLARRELLLNPEEGSQLERLAREVEEKEKGLMEARARFQEELKGEREARLLEVRRAGEEELQSLKEEEERRLLEKEARLEEELQGIRRELPQLLSPLVEEFRKRWE